MKLETCLKNLSFIWLQYPTNFTLRDVQRRRILAQHAEERNRVVCLFRNDLLPKELQELARHKITYEVPRDSAITRPNRRWAKWAVSSQWYGGLHSRNERSGFPSDALRYIFFGTRYVPFHLPDYGTRFVPFHKFWNVTRYVFVPLPFQM